MFFTYKSEILCTVIQQLGLPVEQSILPLPCLGTRYSLIKKYSFVVKIKFKRFFFTNC